jgi:hypothetical protein
VNRSFFQTAPLPALFGALIACSLGCQDAKPKPPAPDAAKPKAQADAGSATPPATPKPDAGEPYAIEKEPGEMPGPDAILAQAGSHTVTLADFETNMRRGMLFLDAKDLEGVSDPPMEWFAMPQKQVTLTQFMLTQKILLAEADRRKIAVSPTEITVRMKQHPRLKRWAGRLGTEELAEELKKYSLSEDDLGIVVRDELRVTKLREQFLDEIPDAEVKKRWEHDQNRVTVAVASSSNIARRAEIDPFIEKNRPAIEAYFEKEKARWHTPKMVVLDMLRAEPGRDAGFIDLHKASKELQKKESVEVLAKNLGMEGLAHVAIISKENRRAFEAPVGATGYEEKGPRGAYAWRVVGFQEAKEATLDATTTRDVAAEMMRRQMIVPSIADKLERAKQPLLLLRPNAAGSVEPAEKEAVSRKISQLGISFRVSGPFTNDKILPGFGLAEEVVDAAFKLTKKDPVAGPILSRERAFTIRLLQRTRPDPKEFKAKKDTLRQNYRTKAAARINDRFVAEFMRTNPPSLDAQPLRIKYGVLKKK